MSREGESERDGAARRRRRRRRVLAQRQQPALVSNPAPTKTNASNQPTCKKTRAFPNCTAKARGERGVLVGDQLLSATAEIAGLQLKRPFDRVGIMLGACRACVRSFDDVLSRSPHPPTPR